MELLHTIIIYKNKFLLHLQSLHQHDESKETSQYLNYYIDKPNEELFFYSFEFNYLIKRIN